MSYENDLTPVDIHRIEMDARRMRAEAFRSIVVAIRARIAGLFAGRASTGARTA